MLEWLPYDQNATKPDLAEALVIIVEPTSGSKAVSLLPSDCGFAASLKRIRPHKCPNVHLLEVLIGTHAAGLPTDLEPLVVSCECCGQREMRTLVPSAPPYTRAQASIWSTYWPCAFKTPSVLPLSHTPEELQSIRTHLSSLRDNDTLMLHHSLRIEIRERDSDDSPLSHSTMRAIARFSQSHENEEQYYCTGAVVIMKKEPCVMCAMAMVHSRVDRVYFQDAEDRGAFTRWKLHRQPLNYMYRVVQLLQA